MRFDDDGPWELPVEGFEVLHMTFGAFLVDIVAYGAEGVTSQIRLEGPSELHAPSGQTERLDPQNDSWERLAALFVLRHDKIQVARITKTSDLYVEFASGHVLTSSADGPYESWEMHAPDGILVVGTPGEPAIWDGDMKNRRVYRWDGKEVHEVAEPEPPTPPKPGA
jgi:hypothetical protein